MRCKARAAENPLHPNPLAVTRIRASLAVTGPIPSIGGPRYTLSMHARLYALSSFFLWCSCSSPSSPAQDSGPSDAAEDAQKADGPGPDAGPCGDEQAFKGGVYDWDDGDNAGALAGVLVTVASTGTTATSAPNGRVEVCVPSSGDVELRFTHADFVDHHHWLLASTIAQQADNEALVEIKMVSPLRMLAFYSSAGIDFQGTTRTLLANSHTASPGWPARVGLSPALAPSASTYVPSKNRQGWTAGTESSAEGILFFADTAANATLSATDCEVVTPLSLVGGALTSVDFACAP